MFFSSLFDFSADSVAGNNFIVNPRSSKKIALQVSLSPLHRPSLQRIIFGRPCPHPRQKHLTAENFSCRNFRKSIGRVKFENRH